MKRPSRETVERAVRMYPNGTVASRALGISWATLRTWCQKYGIEMPDNWSRRKKGSGAERKEEGKERKRSNFGRRVCLRRSL